MAEQVAIIGAGGKMGQRAARKIGRDPHYRVLMCESHPERAAQLAAQGYDVTGLAEALREADFVFLAVPDSAIAAVAREAAPLMKAGAMLIMLDAAAAYVGDLPQAAHIGMMITHPCHPPIFTDYPTPEERQDYFGGVARQDILVCLVQGTEEAFARGVEVCRAVFAPVDRAHRVTVEQFAFLEPAMSELVIAAAAWWIREALEAAVEAGVPREAAEAFLAGHARIALAICFGAEKSPFSDAALRAIAWGKRELIAPDWKKVYREDVLKSAIEEMIR
ncbi:MAG: phosphogluconate dehydrogenase C-terminal domain-containing protein [Bryobacteraceae bacterium]